MNEEIKIEGHIEVLKDTLIVYELFPFTKTKKRKSINRSKFYFFDTGISNYLSQKLTLSEGATDLGTSFEQFIVNEVRAYISYNRKQSALTYWRSRDKEVDLIIGQKIAIEVKFSKNFKVEYTTHLKALREENLIENFMVVGRFSKAGIQDGIKYMNYEDFLNLLWSGKLGLN